MYDALIEPLYHLLPLARFALVDLLMVAVMLGPYLLDVAPKNAAVAHFILENGKLFFMFFGGTEIDLTQFNRISNGSSGFGLLAFTFPLLARMLVCLSAGFPCVRAMLNGSLPAPHTLIAFPFVEEHGKLRNEALTVAIGATVYESCFQAACNRRQRSRNQLWAD
jgi:Kef-type K+ transport system membrane component KefB